MWTLRLGVEKREISAGVRAPVESSAGGLLQQVTKRIHLLQHTTTGAFQSATSMARIATAIAFTLW